MCGIVGIISKYNCLPFYADNLFTNMLAMDSIRGPDSTGVLGVTRTGHVDYVKGDTDGYIFTRSKDYGSFKSRIKDYFFVVGHNRKATTGTVSAINAHPFQEKHIILVHNGTLRGTKGLTNTEVDSHAIAHALADHDPVKALGMLDGAYALVWYDQVAKTLNLARNSERPLSLLNYANTWVITSEIGLPLWLQGRENRQLEKDNGIIRVPEKKILVFKLDKLEKAPMEVAYEEYKSWSPPTFTPSPTHHTWPKESQQGSLLTRGNTGNIINITAKADDPKLKAGNTIIFELDDAKTENGAEVLLGSPIFNGEKDENVIVRMVLRKDEDYETYFGTSAEPKLWKGIIQHYRVMVGIPTVFVQTVEPYEVIVDAQNEVNDKNEAALALQAGCVKCKGAVEIKDVEFSIVRKKGDGTWRIVCPKCLSNAIEVAKQANPEGNMRVKAGVDKH